MNVKFWSLLLLFFQVAIASKLAVRNHTCAPSGYSKICILDSLHYKPHAENKVIHNFPSNQSHIRIVSDTRSAGHSRQVLDVNTKFYSLLGQPAILEIFQYAIWNLQIPRTLLRGSFPHSYTRNLTVEPGFDSPALVYLDLNNNYLRNISSIEAFVNLEVLLLSDNFIYSVDSSIFKNLTKLRHLDLSFNAISQTSIAILPQSLVHLNLYSNFISSLDFTTLNYHSLEVLNIERNKLTVIDAPSLIQALPKLKTARIGGNPLQKDDLQQLLVLFQRANISVRGEADEVACWYGEDIHEGVCIAPSKPPRTVFGDIVMSVTVVLVAVALVATLRWVFLAMGRK